MRKGSVDKDGVKKGPWSEEEDNKLRSYILRYGHWNWRLLPKFAGLARCGKSCRLRWVNYLKPGLKRGSFTREEQLLVAKLHQQLGNKWSAMAARLPGRTDNEIKNYWHTHLKKLKQSPFSAQEFSEELILESSGTTLNSQNPTASDDSASSSSLHSAQEISILREDQLLAAENSNEPTSFNNESYKVTVRSSDQVVPNTSQNNESYERWGSSFSDGFEGSFWTSPFLVDDSDCSFSPLLMEEPELYLFA